MVCLVHNFFGLFEKCLHDFSLQFYHSICTIQCYWFFLTHSLSFILSEISMGILAKKMKIKARSRSLFVLFLSLLYLEHNAIVISSNISLYANWQQMHFSCRSFHVDQGECVLCVFVWKFWNWKQKRNTNINPLRVISTKSMCTTGKYKPNFFSPFASFILFKFRFCSINCTLYAGVCLLLSSSLFCLNSNLVRDVFPSHALKRERI